MAAAMRMLTLCVAFLLMPGCLYADHNVPCVQAEGIDVCLADGLVRYGQDRKTLDVIFSRRATFADDGSGGQQIVRTGQGTVIAIVDSVRRQDCDECVTTIRGILVSHDGRVLLAPRIQTVSTCSRGPWDEKMFVSFGNSASKE